MAAASLSATLASSATSKKYCGLSVSVISLPQTTNVQLGICKFSTWNGLKHQGVPTSRYIVKIERRGRCRGKGVYASLFGVGAPEVLVIGVVALLVFGPKGLAEVARNIGKTIRAFQPTIRELQEVSRELKSTLEREIGLDEIQDATKTTSDDPALSNNTSLSEERVKTAKDQLEASAAQQHSVEPENQTQDVSSSSTEADSIQEYLKKLEQEWEALNSEKRKKMASAAAEVNTQAGSSPSSTNGTLNEEHLKTAEDELEVGAAQQLEETASAEIPVTPKGQSQDVSSSPTNVSPTGEHVKTTEELFEASTVQQQKGTTSAEIPAEPEGHSRDVADSSPSSSEADSIQEYLKKLEQEWEALNSEKQKKMASAATELKSQDTQEVASATALSQNPESEDQMSEIHDDVEHQLL